MAAAEATPAQRLKAGQLQALQMVLPESAEVADMLRAWRGADTRYCSGWYACPELSAHRPDRA